MNCYKIIIAFFVLLSIASANQAEWTRNDITNGRKSFASIFFVDSLTGWAAGENGSVMKTTNGGSSWTKLESGYTHDLVDIAFASPMDGCAVSEDGYCLRTTDGGSSWSSQKITQYWLGTICYSDANNVWATGEYGVIVHSSNGGATWHVQKSSISWGDYYDISFSTPQVGWAVGQINPLKTTDGGATWIDVTSGPSDMEIVQFVDANFGWASSGNGAVMRTTDGGETWTNFIAFDGLISDFHFADKNNGWAVGGDGSFTAILAHTTDGGQTWTKEFEEERYSLDCIFSISPTQCRAGGWYRSVSLEDTDQFFVYSANPLNPVIENSNSAGATLLIKAKPNESNGRFAVAIRNKSAQPRNFSVEIYASDGSKVENLYASEIGGLEEIDIEAHLGHLPQGKYFLYVRAGDDSAREEIIIVK